MLDHVSSRIFSNGQRGTNSPSNISSDSSSSETSDQLNIETVSLRLPMSARFAQSLQMDDNTVSKYSDILASTKISLKDMSRAVPPQYHHYTISLLLNLTSPIHTKSILGQGTTNDEEVFACFIIEAPRSLFHDLNSSMNSTKECSISPNKNQMLVPREMLAHTGDHLPASWCSQAGASPINLDYREEPLWTVYISSADKRIINLHLMATSVFLFALLGVILLVVVVKGAFYSRKAHFQRYSKEENDIDLALTNNSS